MCVGGRHWEVGIGEMAVEASHGVYAHTPRSPACRVRSTTPVS
jgi:hypothetical protein